jgi:hypothetical protein
MEALHLLSGAAEPATIDNAIVIDLRTLALGREHVERDDLCPACGPDRAGELPRSSNTSASNWPPE